MIVSALGVDFHESILTGAVAVTAQHRQTGLNYVLLAQEKIQIQVQFLLNITFAP